MRECVDNSTTATIMGNLDMEKLQLPQETGKDKAYILLKGAIGAIPIVGSIASETFGLLLTAPITKRREEWMQAVVNKLGELEQINSDFKIEALKENQEFISFLLESTQIAFKTHQEEKLNVLKNSIGNFFLINSLEYDKKYSFLKIVDEISTTHLKILFFISYNENYIVDHIKGYPQLYEKYQKTNSVIDKFHFRKCIKDLENQSLIRISRDFSDFVGGGGFATDESAPSIIILDYGKDFLKFIETKI